MKKRIQKWIALAFLLLPALPVLGHGVLVGYQIGNFPGGNNVRVWIEHWHGAATNVSSFPLQYRINTNTTTGNTITTYATGYVNGQDSTTLQNNQNDIIFLDGACSRADNEGNWVYWDFNISVCSTNPTQLEIVAGTAATTMEGCSSLYPQTIGGINAPKITASPVTYACSPTTVDPSSLTNYTVNSLCDPNPDVTLSYGGSSWQVGTTPVPTWNVTGPGQVTITALDKQTQLSSTSAFQVGFNDNTPPTLTSSLSQFNLYLDSSGNAMVPDTSAVIDQLSDNCGVVDTVYFTQEQYTCADVDPSTVATAFDFNTGALPAGWNSSPYSVGQPCNASTGNTPDNSNYFWATSNSSGGFRFVETNALDVSNGGTLDFYIRYGDDDPSNGCEDGDQASEEVYLQYSTDGGSNWTTFYDQWDITGNQEPWYRWFFNSIPIPTAAQTSSTKFRWYQPDNSGSSFDNWGLEDVSVSATRLLQTSLIAKDATGNATSLDFAVDVIDTLAPVLQYNADTTIALNANGQATLTAADLDLGTSDNCAVDSLNLSQTTFGCAHLGSNTVTIEAVDPSGNRQTASVQVTVVDSLAPTIKAKDYTVYLDSSGTASVSSQDLLDADSAYFTFNSGNYDGEISFEIYRPDGSLLQNFTSAPSAGLFLTDYSSFTSCSGPCGFKIVGNDSYGDGWNGASIDVNIGGTTTNFTFNNGYSDTALIAFESGDNCSLDSLYISQNTFSCSDAPQQNVMLYALDASGNIGQDTAVVTVVDTLAPNIASGLSQLNVYLDSNGVGLPPDSSVVLSQQSDNCGIDTFYFSQDQFGCADVDPSLVATAFDFNTGTLPAGWNSSPFSVGKPCDSATGNTPDNSSYFWATSNSPAGIRFVETNALDVSNGGTLDFYIRYGDDDPSNGCEDGDAASEEVYLQYSTDGGTTWVTFYDQWDITGNPEPWYRWYFNSIAIPDSAQTASTKFRWYQPDNSGSSFDNWGLEDVSVSATQLLQTVVVAEDASGNAASLTLPVDVQDTLGPVLHFNADTVIALNAQGKATLTAAALDQGTADNCAIDSLNLERTAFSCADLGTNHLLIEAIDPSGNATVDTVQVDVIDTIAPEVAARDVTVYLDSTGLASITPTQVRSVDSATFSFNSGSWDSEISFDIYAPDGSLLQSFGSAPSPGSFLSDLSSAANCPAPCGYQIIGFDSYGDGWNGASIDISIGGSVTNFTFNSGSSDTIVVSPFRAGDNCTLDSLYLSQSNFTCQDTGVHAVLLNAEDQSANLRTDTAMVTVLDTIAPQLATQAQTIYLDSNGVAQITAQDLDNGTSSNCALDTIIVSKRQFSCGEVGNQSVQITAKDENGNQSSDSVTITVVDSVAPTLLARNLSLVLGPTGTVNIDSADVDNGSFDNCGIASLTITPNQLDTSNYGNNAVVVSLTDVNGNVSQQTITVNILDTEAPQVNTKSAVVYLDSNGVGSLSVAQVDSGSTDNVGIASLSLSETIYNCGDLGQNTVTLLATDASGNTAQKTAVVSVLDTIAPQFSRPDTLLAYADNLCRAAVSWTNGLTDNCAGTNVTSSRAPGSFFGVGLHDVVSTATDAAGNITRDTLVVEVRDTIAPTFVGAASVLSMQSPGPNSCGAFVSWVAPTAYDLCAPHTITSSDSSGSFFPVGTHTVTFTAADDVGNSRTYTLTFVVTDDVDPVAQPPAAITQANDAGQCGASVNLPAPTGTDNCGVDTAYYSRPNPDFYAVGTHTVTLTVEDSSGNTDQASFTVTVSDQEAPQFTQVPNDTLLGYCNAAYSYALPTGSDNCSNSVVTQIKGVQPGNTFPTGTTLNQFVITDNAGNTDTASFRVEVADQMYPDLSNISDICVNAAKVDLRFGDPALTFSGNYVNGNLFDAGLAGTGNHPVSYTYTDSLGCQTTGQINITVVPAPTKPMVTRQGAAYLTTGQYHRYQWLLNGAPISGATNQSLQVTQSGYYRVKVWSPNGCSELSEAYPFGSVSLVEFGPAALEIYPSPTTGEVRLEVPNMKGDQHLKVYDAIGKLILDRDLKKDALNTVDLSNHPTGLYRFVISSSRSNQVVVKSILRKD